MQEHLGGFPDGHNACHLRQGTADFYMQAQFTLTLCGTPLECMNCDTQTRHSKISPVGKLLQAVLCERPFASLGDSLVGCILLVWVPSWNTFC